MKADLLTSVMKTTGSMQDEKTRTVIDSALNAINEQAKQNAETAMNNALDAFSQAKSAHTENMLKLNDINAAITRSEKERQNAQNESTEAEQSWRSRLREQRGVMTPELKAEYGQRIAGRELAEEFSALIDELEDDKSRTMLHACASGKTYINAHRDALSLYARHEWSETLKNVLPLLSRALLLRLRELEMNGEEFPRRVLIEELGTYALEYSHHYSFNMEQEPVLSQLGLYRPALTGVDMQLYKSPTRQITLSKALFQKKNTEGVK